MSYKIVVGCRLANTSERRQVIDVGNVTDRLYGSWPPRGAFAPILQRLTRPTTPAGAGRDRRTRCSGCAEQDLDGAVERNGNGCKTLAAEELDLVPRQRFRLDNHVM